MNSVGNRGWFVWTLLGGALLLSASGCSEEESVTDSDGTPPAAVTDLRAAEVTPTTVTLQWSASGDDSLSGRATAYDLRYATAPFDAAGWDALTQAEGEPPPATSGSEESFTVAALTPETDYYFGLVVRDEAANASGLSNLLAVSTERVRLRWTIDPSGGGDFLTIGEAIAAAGAGDTLRILAGVYDEALSFGGHELVLIGAGPDQTRIEHASDLPGQTLVFASDSQLELREIGFRALALEYPNGFTADDSRVALHGCALIECGLTSAAGELLVSQCTIASDPPTRSGEPAPLVWLLSGSASFERSIIVNGSNYGIACQESDVSFLCNDCFGHGEGNYTGCSDPTGLNGNISEDPRFVDPASGDFRLQPDSPCAGVSGCGPMGAFEVVE
ncbi:MAG: hypothetical protein GF330_04715 [Candidatus Eisenbacteria bacterium]|nr:hypothetical protein [Candidatus Eisenbacteria bacterium]